MQFTIFLSLLLTLLAAGGCTENVRRSESETPAAQQPRPAQPQRDLRPVIAAFGDSLTEGYGAEPGRSYPDFLQQMLDANGYRYRVVNLGISGDTTTGGLGRIDSVIGLNPKIVILELGGNDGLRGIPIASTRRNLAAMLDRLRKANIDVVLVGMTLPPNYGPEYIRAFEGSYRDLARKHNLVLIPFLLQDLVPRLRKGEKLMQPDGIHPVGDGNRIVAGTVFEYLKPLLDRQTR